jgi:hypothetical protein
MKHRGLNSFNLCACSVRSVVSPNNPRTQLSKPALYHLGRILCYSVVHLSLLESRDPDGDLLLLCVGDFRGEAGHGRL